MMQGWYYVESLTGQRHGRVQTESQIATVDSCFDLVGSLQHGVASCEVFSCSTDIHKPTICRWWWPKMKLKSKSLPIGQCHMQSAWQGTTGKVRVCEYQSTSWMLHSLLHRAEETLQGWNSCPRLQFGFQFGLYRVFAPLSFLRSISLASLFNKLTSVFYAPLLLLIVNFVITLST